MELKVKIKLSNVTELKETIIKINEIEKEYSCNCTLLETEIG